jgi:hypothetical protein
MKAMDGSGGKRGRGSPARKPALRSINVGTSLIGDMNVHSQQVAEGSPHGLAQEVA